VNYLGRVQVLEDTLHEHAPGAELHILLCEHPTVCEEISRETGRKFYSPADIGCDDWLHMAYYYNITEYNTALKPFFLEHLFNKGHGRVFYFDPDIEIFGSMAGMESLLSEHDVVLTPHICKPLYFDAMRPGVDSYVRAGQFNLGFLGIAASDETREFLKWWQSVCVEKCICHNEHKFFVDQFWADMFPSFVGRTFILREPGYNVAYWNIFQRELESEGGKWLVEGREMKFFHFSGLDKKDLTKVSIHQNRVTAPKDGVLYSLLEMYFKKINELEWSRYNTYPYSFKSYADGKEIAPVDRRLFLMLGAEQRKAVSDPFKEREALEDIFQAAREKGITGDNRGLEISRLTKRNQLFREFAETIRTRGLAVAVWLSVRYLYRKVRRA